MTRLLAGYRLSARCRGSFFILTRLTAAARLPENIIGIQAALQEGLPFGLERPRGAGADTLAAKDTGGIHHAVAHEGADGGMVATAVKIKRVGELRVVGADLNAAPAVDALVVIAQVKGIIVVDGRRALPGIGKPVFVSLV